MPRPRSRLPWLVGITTLINNDQSNMIYVCVSVGLKIKKMIHVCFSCLAPLVLLVVCYGNNYIIIFLRGVNVLDIIAYLLGTKRDQEANRTSTDMSNG